MNDAAHIKASMILAAKFFRLHPERRCRDAFARDKHGEITHIKFGEPFSFCPIGRIAYEAEIDSGTEAMKLMAGLGLEPINLAIINDASPHPEASLLIAKRIKAMAGHITTTPARKVA